MIVPMKKVSLVVMDRDRDAALVQLRKLGVVHLIKRHASSDNLSALLDRKAKLETVAGILRNYEAPEGSAAPADGTSLTELVLELAERRKSDQEALTAELKEKARIEAWGDFDPASLSALAASGVEFGLYELPLKAYQSLGSGVRTFVFSRSKTIVRCAVVGEPISQPGSSKLADRSAFPLPERSLGALEAAIAARRKALAEIEASLASLVGRAGEAAVDLARTTADIEFEVARIGMERDDELSEGEGVRWFSGYVPAEDAGLVKRAAAEHGWALIVDEPTENDVPPTKVKNNAFIRLVQPVFDLLGTVPGYREYDISLSFLVFFALFFAMIFGDGGYGSILLAASLGFGLKAKAKTGKVPDGLLLLGVLSTATVAWGAITGTWFALPFDTLPGFLQALVIGPFRPDPALDPKEAARLVQQNVKHLCFIIGTIQLVLAHLKNIKKAMPSLTAIAQLGWLSMVVGLYFLVLNLVLDKTRFPVPPYAMYMIIGGIATYFVFVEQKGGNFFRNILAGFANFLPTFLSAVSSFSDIISYIRLFAVGLAGYAIAESFNGMAAGLPSGAVRIIAGGLILFLGHGLNLAMSALSVVVHGVRLNMLEYSGHLGMEWSGRKYAPFAMKDEARR